MKQHPAVGDKLDERRMPMRRLEEIVDQIIGEVAKDEDDRREWMERQRRYYLRRYVRVDRNTDYPWPGASDIVIPTIDMTIDRVKSTISRVLFTNPLANFNARNAIAQDRVQAEKTYFSWLLSKRMRDFRKQAKYLLDDILCVGVGIGKVSWEYRTEKRWHILKKENLPQQFQNMFPEDFAGKTQQLQRGIIPLLPEERKARMQQNRGEIEEVFKQELNLDAKEPHDQEAIKEIFKLFTGEKEEVRYQTREVLANNPRLDAIDYQDFIVPSCTHDLQKAPRLTQKIFLTESEFLARARDEKWIGPAVTKVLESKRGEEHKRSNNRSRRRGDTSTDDSRRQREGLYSDGSIDLIEIWEHYRWEDLSGGKDPGRVCYLLHPGTRTVLKKPQGIFHSHGLFPFVAIRMEENSGRFYSSRGIPEKLDDIDHEITQRHRAKLNKLELMVPTFKYRFGSQLNPDAMRFRPGAMLPVMRMDDIDPIQVPDYTFHEEREENTLETMTQRYIGAVDTGLTNTKNLSEARTATEISAIQRSATEALSARIEIIQDGFRQIYQMIWDLENQWGSSYIFEKVTGSPKRRLTSEQIKWDFTLDPEGTVMTKDPQAEEQKAFQRMDILVKLAGMEPELIGYKYAIDAGAAVKDWLDRSAPNESKVLLRERTPEEIQQIQQARQGQAELAQRLETGQPVSPQEMMTAAKEFKKVAPNPKTRIIQRGA